MFCPDKGKNIKKCQEQLQYLWRLSLQKLIELWLATTLKKANLIKTYFGKRVIDYLGKSILWIVFILMGFGAFGKSVYASTRKAPYLIYPGSNTEMEVLWQLTTTDTCNIAWGTDVAYDDGNLQTFEYGPDHQHKYIITNLIPGRMYYYQVDISGELHTGSFMAGPPNDARNLKFFAYGDTRSFPATHNLVAAGIVSTFDTDPDYQAVILSVGDLVNSGNTEADWDNQFFSPAYPNIQSLLAHLPYQATIGNHEGTGVLYSKYFPYPFVGGRYWSFDYGPMHVAIVDQYTSYGPGSQQLTWLTNDLASSTKRWKFIVLHEPGWSAGGDHPNNTSVQSYIQPLCLQYGVSIVFGGHNHYYARALVDGVEHLTIGGGGAPLYQPIPTNPNIVATSMSYHYCKIDITDSLLHFTAINTSGSVIDTFTIFRGPVCSYVVGDINSDGNRLASDVTYGVRYLKGMGTPPPDSCPNDSIGTLSHYLYVAADVNADCLFRASDITRLVAYFKGLVALQNCRFFPAPQ
jgi:hypothetical protein